MKNNFQKQSGFGILEALIASGIIAIFAAGIVILGNMSLRSVVINKHRLQAAYLAQEAVEIVKNIRDSNWVDGNPDTDWKDGLVNGINWKVKHDNLSNNWEIIGGPENFNLNLENTGDAVFTRDITISDISDLNFTPSLKEHALDLEVKVSWTDYGQKRDVTINSVVSDWMSY